jgi:hypothetical protein
MFVPPEDQRDLHKSVRLGVISEKRLRQILATIYRDQDVIDNTVEQGDFTGLWNVEFWREDKAQDMAPFAEVVNA